MTIRQSSVTLFLMTKKGYEVLKALLHSNLKDLIANVVIGRDSNVIQDYSDQIRYLCQINSIKYSFRQEYDDHNSSEYLVAISWRWLIRTDKKLIVLHDSILPKYRGFAPLVNMLINGEENLGVSALFASSEYDKGSIILQKSIRIQYPIRIEEAIDLITPLYVSICVSIMSKIKDGCVLESNQQDEKLASYSLWRDEEDYFIDWGKDSGSIRRFVDAVGFPFEGAKSHVNDKTVIIEKVEEVEDVVIENRVPGKVIFFDEFGFPVIVCGKGLIKVLYARYEKNKESLLPLKQFRIRFK